MNLRLKRQEKRGKIHKNCDFSVISKDFNFRQEEWEKVRKADEPKEAPEEEYDSRSLFERLEENKRVKQEEWDAQHDIKNVVRGIDDDEAAFLDKVDDVKAEIDKKRRLEERQELDDYRKMKERLLEEDESRRLKNEVSSKPTSTGLKKDSSNSKKQASLVLGAVVKKRPISELVKPKEPEKRQKTLGALAGLGGYASSSSDENDT